MKIPTQSPIKVLLAEDNPADARLVREFLGEVGSLFAVTHVDRLGEAVAHLKRDDFHVILLDLGLPDSEGLDSLKRTHADGSDTPIIVFTGFPDESLAMAAVRAGAQDYLVKGHVDGPGLRRAIRYAIERKQAEARIRWLTQAVDQGPAAVLITDLQGTIEYVNQRFVEITGYTSSDAIGSTPRILKSNAMPADYYRTFWRAIVSGRPWQGEMRNRRKNGDLYWAAVTIAPIRNSRGIMTHFMAAHEDISVLKRAQEIRDEQTRLAQLTSDIGIALTQEPTLRGALQRCTDSIVTQLDAAFARIWTVDSAGQVLELQASSGLYTRLDGTHSRIRVGEKKIGLIAAERRPHITNSVIGDERVSEQDWAKREGLVSFAGHPLVVGDDLVGVLAMFARQPLSDSTLRALASVADVIAVAVVRGQAKAALRVSEERHRQLFERIPVGIFQTAADGTFLQANPALTAMFGYSDLAGLKNTRAETRYVSQDDRRRLRDALERQGLVRGLEVRYRKADGGVFWGSVEAKTVADPDGGPRHVEGTITDVTERKAAEEALRESSERFGQLAENIREAFFIVDLEPRKTIFVSPTWSEIWGRPVTDAYEDPLVWLESIHPDDRPRMRASLEGLARGQPSIDTFRIQRPDGSVRWVRGRAFPVNNDAGEVYRFVGLSEDITELKETESQLRQAQKMEAVGQLAGGVAHDFNNLLTVITSCTDFLLADFDPDDSRRSDMEEIAKAARRAAELTRQLLVFGRRQVLQPKVLSLNSVAADLEEMLRRLIGEDIDLVFALRPELSAVRVDPGHIEQVIVNLAVNARDAMPKGGKLTIETANVELDAEYAQAHAGVVPGPYVMLAVSDTGEGMSADVQQRIFEPFFTTKEIGKGTGLGLATVYSVVKQSGGSIWVYSEPGAGTVFKIYLPVVVKAPSASRPTAAHPVTIAGTETVLLVEDEQAVRDVARKALVRYGYTVLEAADARAALTLAHAGSRIDLLVTDVVMPGIGGRDLADRLAAVQPGVKVLYMSGYTDDAVVRHGVLEAEVHFIQKPFTGKALATKVREALDL